MFLTILALSAVCCSTLFTLCVLGIFPRTYVDYGTVAAAHADLTEVVDALKSFRDDTGRYPTIGEGLAALISRPPHLKQWKGPYLTKPIGLDPWGNAYVYANNGNDSYTVESYGADGKPGGEGDAADIVENGS